METQQLATKRARCLSGQADFSLTFGCWAALCLAICVAPPFSSAQVDTGAILGTVVDSSGASVADGTVTIVEEDTSGKRTTQTGTDGSYSFSSVKLGIYTLTAEKEGFKTTIQEHIQVTIQARLEINPKMDVGLVSQS